MNPFKHLPNTITCCNLLSGSLAVYYIFQGNLLFASYLVGAGLIFDYFDGMTARLTKSYSDIGKELDSFADMVTFGLVPAFLGFAYLSRFFPDGIIRFIPFIMIAFSALRLAKFNIDTRQSENFIGVPTPANGLFWASLPLIEAYPITNFGTLTVSFFTHPYAVIGFSIAFSYLLVAEIPMFSFKFKNLAWNDNLVRFSFLIFAITLLMVFKFAALPLIILFYIILSVVLFAFGKTKIG